MSHLSAEVVALHVFRECDKACKSKGKKPDLRFKVDSLLTWVMDYHVCKDVYERLPLRGIRGPQSYEAETCEVLHHTGWLKTDRGVHLRMPPLPVLVAWLNDVKQINNKEFRGKDSRSLIAVLVLWLCELKEQLRVMETRLAHSRQQTQQLQDQNNSYSMQLQVSSALNAWFEEDKKRSKAENSDLNCFEQLNDEQLNLLKDLMSD